MSCWWHINLFIIHIRRAIYSRFLLILNASELLENLKEMLLPILRGYWSFSKFKTWITHRYTHIATHTFIMANANARKHPTVQENIPQYKKTSHSTRKHPTVQENIPLYKKTSHTTRKHPTLQENIPQYKKTSHTTRKHPTVQENIPHYRKTSHSTRKHITLQENIPHYKKTSHCTPQYKKTSIIQ